MKRFLTATALTTLMTTAAVAATEAEIDTINGFLPEVNVATLSEEQVTILSTIATSGDSYSEKRAKMRSVVNGDAMIMTTLTEGEMAQLQSYAPQVDFMSFTDAELEQALVIVNSAGSKSEGLAQLRSFEASSAPVTTEPLTEGEMVQLETYAPQIDFASFSDAELQQALVIVASSSSKSEGLAQLRALEN